MGNSAAPAQEQPPHVWEAQRKRFIQLYRNEKKKLKEVREIMSKSYGFHATERQYKRKIKQWKLEKHATAAEKDQALVSLQTQDMTLEMDCVYKLNGKDIAAHKIRRHSKANGMKPPVRDRAKTAPDTTQRGPANAIPSLAFMAEVDQNYGDAIFVDMHELLASIACFIWFETWDSISDQPYTRSELSSPTTGFHKWTRTVVTTTRLHMNNVLVAILYIYRLKKINRTVVGKPGSEYRLVTVALMLANKFLDDNTYTNKTWSDVSGIAVQEIHIMEVEFLSNMRYSLMVRLHQMQAWVKQLGELQIYLRMTAPRPVRIIELVNVASSVRPNSCLSPGCHDDKTNHSTAQTSNSLDPQLWISDSEDKSYSASNTEADSSETWRDESNGNVNGNPRYEGTADGPPTGHEDSDMLDVDCMILCTTNMSTLDHSKPGVTTQLSSCYFSIQTLPSNSTVNISQPRHTEPDMVSDKNGIPNASDINVIPDDIDMLMDIDALDPLANLWEPPPLPSLLTMELPMPMSNAEDKDLQWGSIVSSTLEDGPIPDLDTYLDSSLWEDDRVMPDLSWEPVPLIEQSEVQTMQLLDDNRFEELDGPEG